MLERQSSDVVTSAVSGIYIGNETRESTLD